MTDPNGAAIYANMGYIDGIHGTPMGDDPWMSAMLPSPELEILPATLR